MIFVGIVVGIIALAIVIFCALLLLRAKPWSHSNDNRSWQQEDTAQPRNIDINTPNIISNEEAERQPSREEDVEIVRQQEQPRSSEEIPMVKLPATNPAQTQPKMTLHQAVMKIVKKNRNTSKDDEQSDDDTKHCKVCFEFAESTWVLQCEHRFFLRKL